MSLRTLALSALVLLGCGRAAPVEPVTVPSTPAQSEGASPDAPRTLDAMPWAERVALERAMAEHDPAFAPRSLDGVIHVEAPGATALIDRTGAQVRVLGTVIDTSADATHIVVTAVGRGVPSATSAAAASIVGAHVELAHARATEWWRAIASGLEHGVTIDEEAAGQGPLVVDVAIDGVLRPRDAAADRVDLVDAGGTVRGHYERLVVVDADGVVMPSHMHVIGRAVRIEVDDEGARYPLVVDPLVVAEEALLYVRSRLGAGALTALSGDGNHAVTEDAAGTIMSFTRAGGWQQDDTTGFQPCGAGARIAAIALSNNGTRAIVGCPNVVTATSGGLVVFLQRAGTSWSIAAMFSGAATTDQLGAAVAMAPDGLRAIASDPVINNASIYHYGGAGWAGEATVGVGAGFGVSAVAIAGTDDRVAIVGTTNTRITHLIGAAWTTEVMNLATGDGTAGARSAAFSTDGSMLLVGVATASHALVYTRAGTTWTAAATLTDPIGGANFGRSAGLAGDGSRALVGSDTTATVFLNTAGTWSIEQTFASSGTSVGLSIDGATALHLRSVEARSGTSWSLDGTLDPFNGAMAASCASHATISADGSRAALDCPVAAGGNDNLIFSRAGTRWSFESTVNIQGPSAFAGDASRVVVDHLLTSSAVVWVRNGTSWANEATLTPVGATASRTMTVAMSAAGDRALLGAPNDTVSGGANTGRAYVFVRSGGTWMQEAVLQASDVLSGDGFGTSVSLSADGSRALIGSASDDTPTGGMNAGSARVWLRTGSAWTEEATLLSATGVPNDALGTSVQLSSDGTRAIAGAPGAAGNAGNAVVFSRSGTTWTLEQTLMATGAASGQSFGSSVTIDQAGRRVVVGAPNANTTFGTTAGNAHLFGRIGTTWTHAATILPAAGAMADGFASSVRLTDDGSRFISGIPRADLYGLTDVGVARVFTITGSAGDPCSGDAGCGGGTTCVDGVCCASACGGGVADCQACSIEAGGTANGTCTPMATAVVCRASVGTCDVAESCDTATAGACPVDAFSPSTTVCRGPAGMCDVAETCTGTSSACPADQFSTSGTVCRPNAGTCDVAETCSGASSACPSDTFLTAGIVCRAAVSSACDVQEVCSGSSGVCPPDVVQPAGVLCRGAISLCDAAEYCTGTAGGCPTDAFAPSGTLCNGMVFGPCDAPDMCDGTSALCPQSFLSGNVCRPMAGSCDVAESCNGSSAACPADTYVPAGVGCGGMVASCAIGGTCNGASPMCIGGGIQPAGHICSPAMTGNPCDLDDVCDGTHDTCPATWAPATTVCNAMLAGPCDVPDMCTGTSGTCPPTFMSGIVCRASSGACDVAETCNGSMAACPPDGVLGSGVVCRTSTMMCDPSEACDGTSTTCPPDVNSCTNMPDSGVASDTGVATADTGAAHDAGTDAASATDASTLDASRPPMLDAGGAPPPAMGSCGCRTSRGPASATLAWLGLVVLTLARRRSR